MLVIDLISLSILPSSLRSSLLKKLGLLMTPFSKSKALPFPAIASIAPPNLMIDAVACDTAESMLAMLLSMSSACFMAASSSRVAFRAASFAAIWFLICCSSLS